LEKKNYYLSYGSKFGGNFLVYEGDPETNHALAIIHIIEWKENLFFYDLIAFNRVATSTKKKLCQQQIFPDFRVETVILTILYRFLNPRIPGLFTSIYVGECYG